MNEDVKTEVEKPEAPCFVIEAPKPKKAKAVKPISGDYIPATKFK